MNAHIEHTQTVEYFAKELSWLSFNERVLQEAKDKNNPIIERMRFLGIFSNNLDEFFRVRVADVKRRILLNKLPDANFEEDEALLSQIQQKVLQLGKKFNLIHQQILNDLTPGERTVCPLPHDGYLFLEHDVPSLSLIHI